jgi:hypothetical protein
VGLERGPLSPVSTTDELTYLLRGLSPQANYTEELLDRNSSGSGLENRECGRKDPPR